MKYFIIGLILFFFSCSKSQNDNVFKSKNDKITKSIDVPKDTLNITGKAVVFFSISQPEYDQIAKDTNSGIEEALSDFNYYTAEVEDTIRKQGYIPIETASRYIKIILDDKSFKIFDRLSNNSNMTGFIITNGKAEPKIDFGVGIDEETVNALDVFNKN